MGLNLINIIMEVEDEIDKDFIYIIKESFPLFNVSVFHSAFTGIIGQLDVDQMYDECERFNKWDKYGVKSFDDIAEKIYEFEDEIIKFSKIYSNKIFGYIVVDCTGGMCFYEGFAVSNGNIILKHKGAKDGHVNILKEINKKYDGYYFKPFTREFIRRNEKGQQDSIARNGLGN